MLVDGKATHNLIGQGAVAHVKLKDKEFARFEMAKLYGYSLACKF